MPLKVSRSLAHFRIAVYFSGLNQKQLCLPEDVWQYLQTVLVILTKARNGSC